jgi:hypothetical protein
MSFLPAAFWLVLACLAAAMARAQVPPTSVTPATPPTSKDAVFIVAMAPESLVDGIETEVELTVAYELTSKPEAIIELAANNLRPQSASPFTSQRVTQGSGTVTVRGKLTPRFWTDNIVPRVTALLVVPGVELTQRKAVASDNKAVLVTLRPNPSETYTVNPNPSVVHEDGVRIKSITPDRFVDGQAVELEVVVSYDLRSRETGELTLNLSRGVANSYTSVIKLEVKASNREAVLRGRVVPKRTGTLPFAKIQVNLFELPRRTRSIPLANDSETVEVK